jgi:hypothetical protein
LAQYLTEEPIEKPQIYWVGQRMRMVMSLSEQERDTNGAVAVLGCGAHWSKTWQKSNGSVYGLFGMQCCRNHGMKYQSAPT